MSKASNSTTTKTDETLHRLTDIDTNEVSLVDRAANKRKWIVTKNAAGVYTKMFETIDKTGETDMSKIAKGETSNVSTETVVELLNGLSIGLTKMAELTEQVKTFTEAQAAVVEKGEACAQPPIREWGTAIETVTKSLSDLFVSCPALGPAVVVKSTEELAAEATAKATDDAAKVAAEKAAAEKTATDEAARIVAEKAAEVANAQEKIVAVRTAVTEIANELTTLSKSEIITLEGIKAVVQKMDGVYVSGGLMIDTYDIAALSKLCNAICTVMAEDAPASMAKSASLTLAEAASRVAGIAKKLETDSITDGEGKKLKVVELMLDTVTKSLAPAAPAVVEAVVAATKEPEVKKSDIADLESKFAAMLDAAVTKAIEPLKTENEKLKTEKATLAARLEKAETETPSRTSSSEPAVVTSVDESKLFPLNYNADKQN